MLSRSNLMLAPVLVMAISPAAMAATILMDFGPTGTGNANLTITDAQSRSWNNVQSNTGDTAAFGLKWTDNTSSGATMRLSNISSRSTSGTGFNDNAGGNTAGTTSPTGTAAARGYPSTATRDSLYGNTTVFSTFHAPDLLMTLEGLQAAMTYDLYFFASRTGTPTANRSTDYAVQGAGALQTVTLNAQDNTGTVVSVLGVSPTAGGQITVKLSANAANTTTEKFYYLGVMEIVAVPEPAFMGLLGLTGLTLIRRRR